jgi:hypothetical protein
VLRSPQGWIDPARLAGWPWCRVCGLSLRVRTLQPPPPRPHPLAPAPTGRAGRVAARFRLSDSVAPAAPAAGPGRPAAPGAAAGPSSSSVRGGGGLRGALAAAFLPEGYPASVTPDYPAFIAWHAAQGLSSYIRGVLSTHAVLRGVGVGNQARAGRRGSARVWAHLLF